jgi:hypothetical protein|nr:MAG TPA_asm: hypothetical protein [Caudoviricetes sp.]
MYKEIVKKNWNSGNKEIMHKSVDMIADLLEEIKEEHPEKYWLFIRQQQGLMSSGHYNEEFARYDVEKMWHLSKDGKKHEGEHWTIKQAKQVMQNYNLASPINEYDVYVALNAFWHDLECVIPDEDTLIEAAVAFWFKDCDFDEHNKVWRYFCM